MKDEPDLRRFRGADDNHGNGRPVDDGLKEC
jgi:hypothetical protein